MIASTSSLRNHALITLIIIKISILLSLALSLRVKLVSIPTIPLPRHQVRNTTVQVPRINLVLRNLEGRYEILIWLLKFTPKRFFEFAQVLSS